MSTFVITDGRAPAAWPIVGPVIGELINLDFVTKVLYGGNFKAPTAQQDATVYFFHGVSNGTGLSGGTTAYAYESPEVALAVYNYLLVQTATTQPGLEIATDLRQPGVFIDAVSPATVAAAGSDPIYLHGSGFVNNGTVYINSIACKTVFGADNTGTNVSFILDPLIGAGTYDVIWTAANGNYAVKLAALIVT